MITRIGLAVAALFLGAIAGSPAPASAAVDTTFYFRGECQDCSGYGYGELIVQDYVLGSPFDPSEFVSFSYASNLIAGSPFITAPVTDFSGSIGPDFPNEYSVFFQTAYDPNDPSAYRLFFSNAKIDGGGGDWCVGQGISCAFDVGPDHLWSLTPFSVPEPVSGATLGVGLAGLASLRRRRTRLAAQA